MTCLCIMLHLLYIIVSIWCTCVKNTVITSCMYINMYDCMFVDDEGCNSFVENVCSHVQYACSVDNFRSVVITKKLMLRLQKLKQCTCTQHMYTTHVHTNQCIQFVSLVPRLYSDFRELCGGGSDFRELCGGGRKRISIPPTLFAAPA